MDTVFISLNSIAWLVSLTWIGFLVKLEVLDKIGTLVPSCPCCIGGASIYFIGNLEAFAMHNWRLTLQQLLWTHIYCICTTLQIYDKQQLYVFT
jgi:hypothetical protein